MDTGFNIYHGADPAEYDLVLSNSEGGLDRLRELGARRAEVLFWGADPELFAPPPVEKDADVFFYGYGDKFRRDWMHAMIGEPSRRLPEARLRPRRHRLPRRRRPRPPRPLLPGQHLPAGDLAGPDQPERRATPARLRLRLVDLAAVRARRGRGCDRLEPRTRGSTAGSSRRPSCGSSRARTRPSRPTASCSPTRRGRGARPARTGARPRRAHLRAARAAAALARRRRRRRAWSGRWSDGRRDGDPRGRPLGRERLARRRRIAIVPALNEEELGRPRRSTRCAPSTRASRSSSSTTAPSTAPPRSPRRTARTSSGSRSTSASAARADRLPLRLRARLRPRGPDRRRRPARSVAAPEDPRAGARRRGRHGRRLALRRRRRLPRDVPRRLGITVFARTISAIVGQTVTDTTSGFRAVNRRGIALFARDYPHDYPEVEATVMAFRHRLRLHEVPVSMRQRAGRPLLDQRPALDLLHGQGAARDLRRVVPPQRAAPGGEPRMTPLPVSIAGAIASFCLVLIVLELIRHAGSRSATRCSGCSPA